MPQNTPPATNEIEQKQRLEFVLPFPISINTYYKGHGHAVVTTKAGRNWVQRTLGDIWSQTGGKAPSPLIGPVAAHLHLWMPDDRRRRDVDNYTGKHIWDLFTKAGLWEDDSQVWESHEYRCGKNGKGKLEVILEEI